MFTTRLQFSVLPGLLVLTLTLTWSAELQDQGGGLKFSRRCLMVNPNEACAVGDVNRDGEPDIVAGTHWYAAPDFVPRPVRDIPQIDLGFGSKGFYANNAEFLYDVDGDGWLDVLSGGWTESEFCWYKNPGKEGLEKGWKWKRSVLFEGRAENEAFDMRDLDGDGVPEIVVHCWVSRAPMVAWKLGKTPDGRPTAKRYVLGKGGCGHGCSYGDINGDGRDDILCAAGWYEKPERNVLSQTWKCHAETKLRTASSPFVVADADGDGRNDILWGKGHDYGVYWWEQGEPKPDGTTTWKEHLIDKSWSQAHCMTWADLDGDGHGELITGKRVRGHGGRDPGAKETPRLYYYSWNEDNRSFVRHLIAGGVGTGMQIRVADLNGDNRPDIVVSGKSGTWLLTNEGKKE